MLEALATLWLLFQVVGLFLGLVVGVLAVVYVIYRTFFRPIP